MDAIHRLPTTGRIPAAFPFKHGLQAGLPILRLTRCSIYDNDGVRFLFDLWLLRRDGFGGAPLTGGNHGYRWPRQRLVSS